MSVPFISDAVRYIGADDTTLDLFESQYRVPNGVSYNSYVILDEKIAVMDAVDARKIDEWLSHLADALDGRTPDYLIVSHLEPDHSAGIARFAAQYPQAQIVLSEKAKAMLPQFFPADDLTPRCRAVAEGDVLPLGTHRLHFVMAPMVHWPEVMVEYEESEKILFSADGFGKFGALAHDEDWTCEARRYYFNIVGKYGAPVQALLKKASALDIRTICPLHGPVLTGDLAPYLEKYRLWSSYAPEDDGVLIACASIHGNTRRAADHLAEILRENGAKKVVVTDLARDDMAEAVEDAFRYSRLVLACASYDGGMFPPMEDFLSRLAHKGFQRRRAALLETGSWAPCAARAMRAALEGMKQIEICGTAVTLRSTEKPGDEPALRQLVAELLAD